MADTAVAYLSRELLFVISIISRSSPRLDLVAFVLLDLLPGLILILWALSDSIVPL